MDSAEMTNYRDESGVSLCRHPYPYQAMLAICSDLDETPSAEVYFDTIRFLNSRAAGRFGRGVGLEVGNTMYFDMPAGEFSYWNASDGERERIRDHIRSGFIDCFHSFGDTAASRSHAARALEHLDRHSCPIKVWVDHATAPTNFGRDIMQGYGDVPGSHAYHADLTLAFGVRYVWMGRVTSMVGQDVPVSLGGIIKSDGFAAGVRTTMKEASKIALGALGNCKYAMHRENDLLRTTELRDSQSTTEFFRSNPNPGGVSSGDTAKGLAKVLSSSVLDRLARKSARAIFYTHLGKEIDRRRGFPRETREALERLADRHDRGEILVTTTRRLLDYSTMIKALDWTVEETDGRVVISLHSMTDNRPPDGLTFKVAADADVSVQISKKAVETNEYLGNEPSHKFVTVPWRKLQYD